MKVLVVEDDVDLLVLMTTQLKSAGHQVVGSLDGDVLELVGFIDVLIVDYQLPGMNGLELIDAARRVRPTLPCVLATAQSDLAIRQAALEQGVTLVSKPYLGADLVGVVDRIGETS